MKNGPPNVRGVLAVLLAILVIWFGTLDYRKLVKPDEGRYAEIPREMTVSGDWVTPRLNDLKYFEKPPLQYWATATAYKVFGEHQWTSRLWTALTGFAGILLVWFAGVRLFGREAGRYAALILASSMLYVGMGHINTLDMGVTFFLTLGIVGLLLGQQASDERVRRNWMWLVWLALALAVLSKGLMGLVLPGAALVIYSLVQRDLKLWTRLNLGTGLLIFLLVAAPWFYLVMQANPEFFGRFFIYEHYTRFTTKDLGRFHPWYYFVPVILLGMMPWTVLMFDSMVRAWRGEVSDRRVFNPERFLLIWAVFIYIFFSISGSKLPSYLLPMFPVLALLMGKRIAEMRERVLIWQLAPVLVLAVVATALAPSVAKLGDTPQQVEMYGQYAYWATASAALWLATLAGGIWLLARRRKPLAMVVLAIGTLLATQIVICGHNTVARERSSVHIADAIRAEVKPDVPFYSVLMYEQTLPFYLKRTFTLVQYQDEMAFGILQEPQRWIPTIEQFAPIWRDKGEALAIMPAYLYPQLQQRGLPMRVIFEDYQFVVVSRK
ncbi:MAG: glycosyltransferase family 39 protein [Nitrosomonadales bacterium]|nr:glycosyltransferase family 39 protein [Nitrosomonadales bacterium]